MAKDERINLELEAMAASEMLRMARISAKASGVRPSVWLIAVINELTEVSYLQAFDSADNAVVEAVCKAFRLAYGDLQSQHNEIDENEIESEAQKLIMRTIGKSL